MNKQEEESLSKYDFDEFLFPYKRVTGEYSYLSKLDSDEELINLFDLIITFLNACHRP
jgi:hypothetical protein